MLFKHHERSAEIVLICHGGAPLIRDRRRGCTRFAGSPHSISKRTMRRPTRLPYRGRLTRLGEVSKAIRSAAAPGYWRQHVHKEKRTQHGKPQGVVGDDQPEAREGQAGRRGVAERFVVPLKPGNAGGGKGPQFKTDAIRGEGPGDWATYQLRECSEAAEGVARESKGVKSCPRAGCGKSARPVR